MGVHLVIRIGTILLVLNQHHSGDGAMLLNLLLLVGFAAQAPIEAEQLDLTGSVTGADDRPLKDVTVCIHTAKERVGVSMCPTCYRDCTKQTVTGPDGTFKLADVSPKLLFQILAVAEGFEPTLVANVDPRKGPASVHLKKIDPKRLEAGHMLRGLVLDPEGHPVAGARVYPVGYKDSKTRMWGSVRGVDPLAITNMKGQFLLTSEAADISLDLRIESPGLATADRELLPNRAEPHTIRMAYGVSVKGRVIKQGEPVAGVVVGLAQADRGLNFRGPQETRTDSKGRFHFPNVCAKDSYYLYGIMEDSARLGGALQVKKITTKADGEESSPTELEVVPCYRISGRVTMADGKGVPEHLKLYIDRKEAWDYQAVEVDGNGRFSLTGVPGEQVCLAIVNTKYHFAPENKSVDPFDPSQLWGTVRGDVKDLCIRVAQGEGDRFDYRGIAKFTQEELLKMDERRTKAKQEPLSGVTNMEEIDNRKQR
jgi:hypothetical protein